MKLNSLSICIVFVSESIYLYLYCTIVDTMMDTIYPSIKSGVPNEIKQFIHLYSSILYLYPSVSVSIYVCICIHLYLVSVLYYHGYNLSIHQIWGSKGN